MKITRNKPFKCTWADCDAAFTRSGHLKTHFRIHSGEKPFKCTWIDCNSAFSQSGELAMHLRTHTGEKPFKCSWADCNATFTTSSNLTDHVRTHTGEKPFKCNWIDCNAKFITSSHLTVHVRTHSGEKPFKCTWIDCGAKFTQSGALTVHVRTHSGEKPFKCTWIDCDATFAQSSLLRTHFKALHTEQGVLRQKKAEEAVAKALTAANIHYKREHQINMNCSNNKENKFVRLDFLIIHRGCLVILEVDEHQHIGYPILCDSIRPWKIAETLALEGNVLPIHMIRFNPDAFRIDGRLQTVPKRERYRYLCDYIREIDKHRTQAQALCLTYLYYDQDGNGVPMVTFDPNFANQTKDAMTS